MTDWIMQLPIQTELVNSLIGILLIDFTFQEDDESHATSNYVTIYTNSYLIIRVYTFFHDGYRKKSPNPYLT